MTELFEALKAGKILSKIHHNDSECEENLVYETYDNGARKLEVYGWGSAYGKAEDRILDIFYHPELWKVK